MDKTFIDSFFTKTFILGQEDEDVTVNDFSSRLVSGKGENFMSQMFEVKISAKKNDKPLTYDFMVKILPDHQYFINYIIEGFFFEKEIEMYTKVIPAMTQYQLQNGSKINPPFPKCYYGKFENNLGVLVMENLKTDGFTTVDIKQGLDYDEASAIFEAYAVFHALGFNLQKQLGDEIRQIFPSIFKPHWGKAHDTFERFLNGPLACLKKIKGEESHAAKIETLSGKAFEECVKAWNCGSNLGSICHGDPWITNLMFKYEKDETGNQKSVVAKIVDLQLAHFGTGACDLAEITASSVQSQVQKVHIENLLRHYHKTFKNTIEQLGLHTDYTYENLVKDYQSKFIVGFMKCGFVIDVFGRIDLKLLLELTSENSDEKREELKKKNKEKLLSDQINNEELKSRYLQVVHDAMDYGVFPISVRQHSNRL